MLKISTKSQFVGRFSLIWMYPCCLCVLFSAGIGRTGTFIVIDMILNEIKRHGLCLFLVFLINVLIVPSTCLSGRWCPPSLGKFFPFPQVPHGWKCVVKCVQSRIVNRSFAAYLHYLNSLPASLWVEEISCTEFKKQLKTFLFQLDCGASWLMNICAL